MNKLKPIENHILFQFKEEVKNGRFVEKSKGGLNLGMDYDRMSSLSRVAIVIAVGPDVDKDIRVGSSVVVQSLKWTPGVEIDDQLIWRTDDTCILALLA